MKKVLVIGGSGMVASRVIDLIKDTIEITSVDQNTIDITDYNAVKNYFDKNIFDAVINFAAITNVDESEKDRGNENGITWKLNFDAVNNLAEVCKNKNIFFVHISTDFIFKGSEDSKGPYAEDVKRPSNPDGIGWYGWTKNRAEKVVEETGGKFAIIRYGYPFRAAKFEIKSDWARNLIKLYNEQKLYPLFADQVQGVLLIDELAEPLVKIINNELQGVFHISSRDVGTPYEIGKYLLEKYSGKTVEIKKGSMTEFLKGEGRTPRPIYGGLKTELTQKRLGLTFKTWREMVDEFISQLN